MSDHPAGKPSPPILRWALWGVAAFGVAAVVYIIAQALIHPGQAGGLKSLAKGEMGKLVIPLEAGAAPANSFYDAQGRAVRIADFKGKVVVLNLWATWCAPCVKEMPTLDALAVREGERLQVVTVSQDFEPAKVAPFFAEKKFRKLQPFIDSEIAFSTQMGLNLPATILYDSQGREVWRMLGDTDWAGDAAAKLIAEAR